MVYRDFIINKKTFRRKMLTLFQHKLRVLMKCYTIIDFNLDYDTCKFSFKKSYRINGIKMNDPKTYFGRYELEEMGDDNVKLRIIIGEKNP